MRDKILQMVGLLVFPLTVACATPRGTASHAASSDGVRPQRGEPHGNEGSRKQDLNSSQAVLFHLDESTIPEQDQGVLEKVSSRLKQDQKSVAILEGHT